MSSKDSQLNICSMSIANVFSGTYVMNWVNNDGYSLYTERAEVEKVDRNYGHMISNDRTYNRYEQITSHLGEVSGDCLMTTDRIYSVFIMFSIQFRSTNSIRSMPCTSLMVIISFSRVSCLLLDCVGYPSSKAKWSIFSLSSFPLATS